MANTAAKDYTMTDSSPDISDTSTLPTPFTTTPTSTSTSTPDLTATLSKYALNTAILLKIQIDLIAIARAAGAMMLAASPSTSTATSTSKRNTSDLVTATDRAIESHVQSQLSKLYPHFSFLGEETFKEGQKLGNEPTFICDPIDGTLNFVHGFPNTAISLALAVEKEPVVGVVYNPFRNDLYHAVKNHGAFLTPGALTSPSTSSPSPPSSSPKTETKPIRLPLRPFPPPLPSLTGTLVALEWGSERGGPNWALRHSVSHALLSSPAEGGVMVHSVRSSGSAALDFCYVAAGQLDLFWEGGCWMWDVAAGWCILKEAGGLVVSANPPAKEERKGEEGEGGDGGWKDGGWEPSVEGRCYLAVRGAKRREQEGVVREVWGLMGERRFVF